MPNETKKIETTVINGRTVIIGACWRWGPKLTNPQAVNKQINPA